MVSKASLSRPATRQKRHHSGLTTMASKRAQDTGDTSSAEKEAEKPVRIDKWDGSAVRNALDDAVKKVLTEKYGYVENHRLTDGRLAICSIAVGAAMFALLWDFLYPFPESRTVLIACVLSYFFLMGVLTLYTTFLEKGIFLVALQKDKTGFDPDSVWTVSSSLKRFDHIYHLQIHYKDGKTKKTREAKLEKSIASWFDENGTLVGDLFDPEVCKLHNSLLSEKKEK
uniref:Signal peptidase complex subunit 2 n=1 Tax=Rhipicephalus appendiculatus TaxID=34631 RepID=A0A131YHA7_RHIAP